jgi:hypothetical protein
MALLKDYYNPQTNVTISNAYWKIGETDGFLGGKRKIHVKLCCYENKINADENKNILFEFAFDFLPNLYTGANFFMQAYNHAKTLPQFSGAIDA